MSIISAKAFMERIKTDEEFFKMVKEFKNSEDRMKFVKEAGFDFTTDEIKELNEQLSDSELDNVVGGRDGADNAFCSVYYY